jgi:hypothetical protein
MLTVDYFLIAKRGRPIPFIFLSILSHILAHRCFPQHSHQAPRSWFEIQEVDSLSFGVNRSNKARVEFAWHKRIQHGFTNQIGISTCRALYRILQGSSSFLIIQLKGGRFGGGRGRCHPYTWTRLLLLLTQPIRKA